VLRQPQRQAFADVPGSSDDCDPHDVTCGLPARRHNYFRGAIIKCYPARAASIGNKFIYIA
jgi:hypothetical protein